MGSASVENLIGPEERECEEKHHEISERHYDPQEKIPETRVNEAEN